MIERPLLTLYMREGCHLCEDMLTDLRLFQAELNFELQLADIDSDEQLRDRFHTLVPVLSLNEQQICNYYLDPVALRGALAAE